MLKKVKMQNWQAQFAYTPPVEDAVINTDHIVSVVECDPGRGSGPFVKVTFVDGKTMTCQGKPKDFI